MKKVMYAMMLLASFSLTTKGCSSDDEAASSTESGQTAEASDPWDEADTEYATVSSQLDDNNVAVVWNGTSATVQLSANLEGVVSGIIRGGNVTLLAADSLAEEVTYTLSGNSSRGSLYMDGSYKATFVLNGLNLVSTDSAAINIRDGKRIAIVLADGTSNSLADKSNGSHKACLMVKGHAEFSGDGLLAIKGNTGHAFWSKEYCQLKKSFTGTINVASAVGDGFNVNQYFQMNGGTVNVTGVGDDGVQVSYETDDDGNVETDDENTGEVLIQGGTLSITTTATGSKGIKAEGNLTINEDKGTTVVTIVNTGSSSGSNNTPPGGGWRAQDSSSGSSAKGIKAEGNISISAGTVSVTSASHEGMEAKGTIDISGGNVYVKGSDDAINSGGNLTISGGQVCGYSTGNDGIDANGNCYVKGGTVYAIGSSSPEVAIDANTEERCQLYVSGGTLVAIGGLESGSSLTQTCYQASSWSAGTWYALYSGSTLALAFQTPQSGGTPLVVSTSGTTSLKSGVSLSGGTAFWGGMAYADATVSGGNTVSLSSYTGGNNSFGPHR